jgi:hypothetical protein
VIICVHLWLIRFLLRGFAWNRAVGQRPLPSISVETIIP